MAQKNGGDWATKLQAIRGQVAEVPGESSNCKPMTIFRLPAWYHETNKHLYEPKMVSIGPYHHGKQSLRAMQEQKWCALRNILDKNTNATLDQYFNAVRALEGKARNCYNESVRMDGPNFVTMLLLDACFIIDYFETIKNPQNVNSIYHVGWANIHLYSDLFLLENQIPFFVIHDLFTIRDGSHYCANNRQLLDLLCDPLTRIFSSDRFTHPRIQCDQIDHLLQLYYIMMVPVPLQNIDHHNSSVQLGDPLGRRSVQMGRGNAGTKISCVSELHEAGVKFRKKNNPSSMFDISFKDGVMEIPFIKIEDTHKVILWNMAAFEQSKLYTYKSQILSSYLALMDSLIDTEKDIGLLEKKGIVENYLQSNEDAADLFNQFSKSFVLDYSMHHYKSLFEEVKKYSQLLWHRNRARLEHDYFKNPWTTISVLAAAVLLILTAAQTYFSAMSVYK